MAGNIGGEFNLVVWWMSSWSAKFESAKYSANGDFADLVLYDAAAVLDPTHAEITVPRSTKLNLIKVMNPSNIIPTNNSGHTVFEIAHIYTATFVTLYCNITV